VKQIRLFVFLLAVAGLLPTARADGPKHRKLSAVPFTEVKVQDEFWAPRLRTNREKSLPHTFQWCEKTGRLSNFAKAAGLVKGEFQGIYFNDSDVYKVLEGASYALADQPDPALEKTVDEVIAKIAAAQQPDGYLDTYYTLKEPGKKWTNLKDRHELYCAGHLIEAAVAHHRATGKRTLLGVAVKLADRIDQIFGPDKRHDVPGHEELELALVKLYELTGEERYFNLAKFFIDIRGDKSQRRSLYGPYCQDHMPVRQQSEIVGHAVRAMYLYSGVADVAGYTGDQGYVDAMDRLWQSVVRRKMYLTGGIGVQGHGEGFSGDYALPNAAAYCETCAAIGMALWNHRLNLMHGDAKYADVVERELYNGILSGIALDGQTFFYVNPLASDGRHHRQPFFDCACCPTNVVRFIPSVPGYVYATGEDGMVVNLYVAGTAKVPLGDATVAVTQETRYPWDGKVRLTIEPKQPATFAVNLRIPAWSGGARLSVNGQPVEPLKMARGYAVIHRRWEPGDLVELDLPMEIRRIEANPRVKADLGRVAIQRGPIVYCFEAVDNGGRASDIILPHDPKFTAEHRLELLGGVTVIHAVARDGRKILAVPYYAWDHRQPGEMAVWVRQEGKSSTPNPDDPAWQGRLYRRLDPATLGPATPPSLTESSRPSASHTNPQDSIAALSDGIEPGDSADQDLPRFTWWDHRGSREWVQYDFPSARKVSAVAVYWFDDQRLKRQCRTPQSWRLLYKSGEVWKPVATNTPYGTAPDKYNRLSFTPVETTAVRIEVQLKPGFSGGILEWRVR
jgi:DUF1680 family protein